MTENGRNDGEHEQAPTRLTVSHWAEKQSYRWIILSITTLAQTTVSVLSQSVAPIAPYVQDNFALNRAQVGLLALALASGGYLTLMLSGRLIDRLGERTMMLVSGLVGGSFALAMLAAHSFGMTLGLLALMSVGTAIGTPAGSKAVMSWFELRLRGTAMGIRQVGIPLGAMIASLMLPPLALVVGWRAALGVGGSLAICGALICFAFYRDAPSAGPRAEGPPHIVSVRAILAERNLWLTSLYAIAMLGAQLTFGLYLVVFAHERLGLTTVASGALLALAQAMAVVARIGWGLVSDRLFDGDRNPPLAIIAVIAGLASIGFSFLHPGVPMWTVILGTIALGVSAIGWQGLYVTSISEIAGHLAAGTALGVSLTVAQIGQVVTPPLFGYVVDRTGSYQPAWVALGIFVLVGSLPIYAVRKRRVSETQHPVSATRR